LSNFKCPIAQLNPIMQLTPAERLNFRLWYSVVSRANNQAMSQIVEGSGGTAIHAADANGKMYTFGPVESEKTTYPLFVWTGNGFEMPVVEAIQNWLDTTPEDWMPSKRSPLPWPANIRISSTKLNSYLKAKKREIVHNAVKDVAVKESTVTFKVTRDAEVDDGRGEEHQQFSHDDPQGENVGCSTSAPAYEF